MSLPSNKKKKKTRNYNLDERDKSEMNLVTHRGVQCPCIEMPHVNTRHVNVRPC